MAQESHNPPAVAELIRGCETNTCFVIGRTLMDGEEVFPLALTTHGGMLRPTRQELLSLAAFVNEGGLDRLTAEQMEQVPLSSPEAALQSA